MNASLNGVNVEDINASMDSLQWNSYLNEYHNITISPGSDSLIIIASRGSAELDNVNITDIYGILGAILIRSEGNASMDSVNINGFYPYDYEVFWDDVNKCYAVGCDLETESLVFISAENTFVNDFNADQIFLEEGNALYISCNGNVKLTESSFSNVSNIEGVLSIYSEGTVAVDNIGFKDNAVGYNETYWNREKAEYYWQYGNYGGNQLWIEANNVSLSNVVVADLDSGVDEGGVIAVYSVNANLTNITVQDVGIVCAGIGMSISVEAKDVVRMENILIDNVDIKADNSTRYYEEYGKYITTYSLEEASFGIYVEDARCSYLSNITISNSKSCSESFPSICIENMDNVTLKDVFLTNLTTKAAESLESSGSYRSVKGENSNNGISIESEGNVNITNVQIDNVESSDYQFIDIKSSNITVVDLSIVDSPIISSSDSKISFKAKEFLSIDNFTVRNISACPYNETVIDSNGAYSYTYKSGSSYGLKIVMESNDARVSNVHISNAYGGGDESMLDYYGGNAVFENITIENIPSSTYMELENSSEYGFSFNAGCGICNSGLNLQSRGNLSLFNLNLNNLSFNGEGFIEIDGDNVTVVNASIVNITCSFMGFTNNYRPSGEIIFDELSKSLEDEFYIVAENQLSIVNLLVDGFPASSDTSLCFDAADISMTNSTFRNIKSLSEEMLYDESLKKYNVTYYTNEGDVIGISGGKAILNDVTFENISFGGINGQGAVNIGCDAVLNNCTFRNINSTYISWYIYGGQNQTDKMDTYGSALSISKYGGSAVVGGCDFINCHADYGGAIYLSGPMNITDSLFTNCTSTYDGGAIYYDNKTSNTVVDNVVFLKNIAGRNGGAVYIYENNNTIRDSTFIGNHADYNGGAFFYNNTVGREMFEDYRWYNRTIMFADDMRELDQNRAKILNSKFENNTDYELKLMAPDSIGGVDEIITVQLPKDALGAVNITILDESGNVVNDIDGNPVNKSYALTNGSVTFKLEKLQAGRYNLTAHYSTYDYNANPYYYHVNSTLFTVKNVLNANVTAKNVTEGENTIFTIEVPNNFTGNVSIVVDGEVVYNGTVNSTVIGNAVAPGNKTANVTFYGDDHYVDESKTVNFNVAKLPPSIEADDMIRGWNSPYDYEAVFYDEKHNPLANAEVTFNVAGRNYDVKTDANGLARLTTSKLAIGEYKVTSINKATGLNVTCKLSIVKRLIENKDMTSDYRDGSIWTVRAIDDDGTPVGAGQTVVIKTHGITYKCKTDKNGYAKLLIELLPKSYSIKAEYKGYKVTNKLVIKQTLKPVKKTIKVKKSAKSFKIKAKLKWSNGKAIKGKKIVFKIKGKKYSAKTNKKGIATVKVKKNLIKKLKKGKKYTVKITYSAKMTNENRIAHDTVKCCVKVK